MSHFAIGPDQNLASIQQPTITKSPRKTPGERTTDTRNGIAHLVLSRGTTDRKWSSLNPNSHYLEAFVSGTFGNAANREATGYDRQAFEDAQVTFAGWVEGVKPWKGMLRGAVVAVKDGQGYKAMTSEVLTEASHVWVEDSTEGAHWGLISNQPAFSSPEPSPVPCKPLTVVNRITAVTINHAYEDFIDPTKPDFDLEHLEAALYKFVPMCGRRSACHRLVEFQTTSLGVEDILADFLIHLIAKIEGGKYATHDRQFDHWIARVWTRFLADQKTKIYSESNLTARVNEHDFDDEDAESLDRAQGELYRVDVDREQANRVSKDANASILVDRIFSDLENPDTEWGKLSPDLKTMLRAMRGGATKKQAAEAAGLSEDYARKALADAVAGITDTTAILRKKVKADTLHGLQDEREDAEPHRAVVDGTCPSETFDLDGCAADHECDNVICIYACADEEFEPLLGVPEAAKLLCVHPKTVQAMARAGTIPCTRIGKYWRFRASVLDVWVRKAIESGYQSRRVA